MPFKIKVHDSSSVPCKMNENITVKELMEKYCERQSWQIGQIYFCFDGSKLLETQTLDDLEMEDDDVIGVVRV